jgi:hypothetical protein
VPGKGFLPIEALPIKSYIIVGSMDCIAEKACLAFTGRTIQKASKRGADGEVARGF